MSCGVSQGSVLGLDLWNVLNDDLLKIQLPPDVEIIAFSDDFARVGTAQVLFLLEERLEEAHGYVVTWMEANGLEIALEKTEAILLTNRNRHNKMTVKYGTLSFPSKSGVKYLGVQLDPGLHFNEHADLASKRAANACRQLVQILPNLRGPKQKTRKVLATVFKSRLLYGAPFWYHSITEKALCKMSSVYRRSMLRVTCCYRTVSHDAAAVVSSVPSLKLLAEERHKIYRGADRCTTRDEMITSWQSH